MISYHSNIINLLTLTQHFIISPFISIHSVIPLSLLHLLTPSTAPSDISLTPCHHNLLGGGDRSMDLLYQTIRRGTHLHQQGTNHGVINRMIAKDVVINRHDCYDELCDLLK